MRGTVLAGLAMGFAILATPVAAAPRGDLAEASSATEHVELSAQSRRRARITVRRPGRAGLSPPGYGTDADLSRWKRDCVAVFEPRFIPARGETVIYGSQRCRWVLE